MESAQIIIFVETNESYGNHVHECSSQTRQQTSIEMNKQNDTFMRNDDNYFFFIFYYT